MRRKAKAESGEDGKNSGGQRKTATTAKATDHKEKFETKFPTAQLAPHI
jgi:hypothetical protein